MLTNVPVAQVRLLDLRLFVGHIAFAAACINRSQANVAAADSRGRPLFRVFVPLPRPPCATQKLSSRTRSRTSRAV